MSWSATDAQSGIASSTGCEPITLASETTGTIITCSARNVAGLTSSKSITVRIDKTAPVITASAPLNGAEYVPRQTILANYTCADAISGVASCSGTVPSGTPLPAATAGAAVFIIDAADLAGNTARTSISYRVAGALSTLKSVLADVISRRAQVTDKKDLKTLDDVIEHLQAAVKPSLWIDDTHVRRMTAKTYSKTPATPCRDFQDAASALDAAQSR